MRKNLKTIFLLLLVVSMTCAQLAVRIVFAEGEQTDSVREEDVQQIIASIRNLASSGFDGLNNFREEDVLLDKIKLVNRADNSLVSLYRENGSVASFMSSYWQYIVPVSDGDSVCVFTFLKTENGVEYAASVYGEQADASMRKYMTDDTQIEMILQTSGVSGNVQGGIYVMSYMYRTLFYAFTVDGEEYLIPFSDLRAESGGYVFDNSRVFSAREAVDALGALAWEQTADGEILYGGSNGGTTINQNDVQPKRYYWIAFAVVIVGLPLGLGVLARKTGKGKK